MLGRISVGATLCTCLASQPAAGEGDRPLPLVFKSNPPPLPIHVCPSRAHPPLCAAHSTQFLLFIPFPRSFSSVLQREAKHKAVPAFLAQKLSAKSPFDYSIRSVRSSLCLASGRLSVRTRSDASYDLVVHTNFHLLRDAPYVVLLRTICGNSLLPVSLLQAVDFFLCN